MRLLRGKKQGFIIKGSPQELRRASHWPGSSMRVREGCVRIPQTITSWKVLRDQDFTYISPEADEAMESLRSSYTSQRKSIRVAYRRFKKTGETDIPVPLRSLPYSHQVRAFGFATMLDGSALFMDQGTGKTLVAIAVAGHRYQRKQVRRVVVVCPKSVKPVWPKEMVKHAGFPWSVGVDGPPEGEGLQIWITNYDRVKRELKRLRKWKPDMVILDESHRIKNRKAQRTTACINLGKASQYNLILSGTPMGKCISEVWSQFKFIDPSVFGSQYSMFKARYLRMGGYMGYSVVGYENEEEFSRKLHSISFRVTKDECLDLPPLIYQKMYIEPDAQTLKAYQDLDLHLFLDLGEDEVTASSEATKQMKLRQVVGGSVRTDGSGLHRVSQLKASTLKEVMEDRVNEKTVIFFSFTHEIRIAEEIMDSLGIPYLTLEGKTKPADREVFETRFEEEMDSGVALIQVQTGGEGITLVSADMAIFYSPTFSYIGYSQARDRLRRIGQLRPVTVVFLVLLGTVDERVVHVLECNGQLVDNYLEHQRDYRLGESTMAKTEGFTAKQLAEELGITPAELRKHLRAEKIQKPEGGWSWPKKTDASLNEIRKTLKARLKRLDEGNSKKGEEKKPAAKKKAATPKKTDEVPGKKVTRRKKAEASEE